MASVVKQAADRRNVEDRVGVTAFIIAEHAEQTTHLFQRTAGRCGYGLQRFGADFGVGGIGVAGAIGEGDHGGQVVGHNVVHFAGDAGALHNGCQFGAVLQSLVFRLPTPGHTTQLPEEPHNDPAYYDGCDTKLPGTHIILGIGVKKLVVHHLGRSNTGENPNQPQGPPPRITVGAGEIDDVKEWNTDPREIAGHLRNKEGGKGAGNHPHGSVGIFRVDA